MTAYVIPGLVGVILTIITMYVFELTRTRKPSIVVPCKEELDSYADDRNYSTRRIVAKCQGAADHVGVHYGTAGNDSYDVWWSKREKKS